MFALGFMMTLVSDACLSLLIALLTQEGCDQCPVPYYNSNTTVIHFYYNKAYTSAADASLFVMPLLTCCGGLGSKPPNFHDEGYCLLAMFGNIRPVIYKYLYYYCCHCCSYSITTHITVIIYLYSKCLGNCPYVVGARE